MMTLSMSSLLMKLPPSFRVLPVMFGAVLIHLSLGTYHTFGNMLPYMASYMRNYTDSSITEEEMVWIPTLQGCFPLAMVLGGLLAHKLGPRIAAGLGCLTMVSGVYLSSFTISISLLSFVFTYGFMYGLGQGIAYVVAVSSVINWAPDRVGLVSGVVAAGFGLSSSIFAPIQTALVNPSNYPPQRDGYFIEKDLLEKVPVVFRMLASVYALMQMIGLLFICDPPSEARFSRRQGAWQGSGLGQWRGGEGSVCCLLSSPSLSLSSRPPRPFSAVRYSVLRDCEEDLASPTRIRRRSQSRDSSEVGEEERDGDRDSIIPDLAPLKSSLTPPEMLRSPTFYALFTALFCCSFYANTFYNLYKTFALTFIEDDMFLAMAFSVGSIANAAARIAWGHFTDRTSFQMTLSVACCVACALLLSMPLTSLAGKWVFLAWLTLLFTCMAATHALFITAVVKCFGARYKATNYGLLILSTTLSGVALSLLSQYALGSLGYSWMFLITAIFPFTAFVITANIDRTPHGHFISG